MSAKNIGGTYFLGNNLQLTLWDDMVAIGTGAGGDTVRVTRTAALELAKELQRILGPKKSKKKKA